MSVARAKKAYDFIVWCDTTMCPEVRVLRVSEKNPTLQNQDERRFWRELVEEGWTRWVGARARREYCPKHGPSRGSKLENITERTVACIPPIESVEAKQ